MDTITHGIAGALISKAVFRGEDLFAPKAMNRARIISWSLMLGAIFPDSDVFRDFFSRDPLLIITWHRSVTHSLLCMPLFALLLAALSRWLARWRKWDAPSFAAFVGIYAIGILSHIFLDLVTSFGTMVWSPLKWSRPAWDVIFIVDFTLSAILLLPQLVAWVYAGPEHTRRRALRMWLIFAPAPVVIAGIGQAVGAPISAPFVLADIVLITALFLLPALRGWGLRVRRYTWNRVGLSAALAYIAGAAYAHHTAVLGVEKFARQMNLEVQALGALPLPPSLWHWDGLVRTPRGVYELRMDLSNGLWSPASASLNSPSALPLEHRYYPDAFPNVFIDAARQLPEVQKVLWFARFPVTRFHKEGDTAVVEFLDLRFRRERSERLPGFTYRVKLDAAAHVLSKGWVRE